MILKRKIPVFIIMMIVLMSFSVGCEKGKEPSFTPTPKPTEIIKRTPQNIKIIINKISIYQEQSINSKVIGFLESQGNDVFETISESIDKNGKLWFKIEKSFGIVGWVEGSLCEKTKDQSKMKPVSKDGELLDSTINEELFIKILIMDNYSLHNLLDNFGKNYTTRLDNYNTRYDYPSGLYFTVTDDGGIDSIGIGSAFILYAPSYTVYKKTCNIFQNPGDEIVISYIRNNIGEILIVDAKTMKVLKNYTTGDLTIYDFEEGDFLRDGSKQLYIKGIEELTEQKRIYKIIDDCFQLEFDIYSLNNYKENIKATISGNELTLAVTNGNNSEKFKSILPEHLFYDNKDVKDNDTLISIDGQCDFIMIGGKWFVSIKDTVNFNMLDYYWGPPVLEDVENNALLCNDLARIDFLIEFVKGKPSITKIDTLIKYNNPELLKIKQFMEDEGKLVNGPVLGMGMEEAYIALGGDIEKYEYSDYIEYKGVLLSEFCAQIVNIIVKAPDYMTTRGLRIGDSIDRVETLYGKPDVGFSGDERVEYYVIYEFKGEKHINAYRGLNIGYKNGVVSSFDLYQEILD